MVEEIKKRTKKLGIEIIKLVDEMPSKISTQVVARQIIRSSTSIGANYRAACRAKSKSDFINKLKIVEEEADETMYWLEIIEESKFIASTHLAPLKKEVNEIISIVVASIKTLRNKS
jgi:four helix bundle protein